MHLLLLSIGTRGDMEPFLAVGKILEKQGTTRLFQLGHSAHHRSIFLESAGALSRCRAARGQGKKAYAREF